MKWLSYTGKGKRKDILVFCFCYCFCCVHCCCFGLVFSLGYPCFLIHCGAGKKGKFCCSLFWGKVEMLYTRKGNYISEILHLKTGAYLIYTTFPTEKLPLREICGLDDSLLISFRFPGIKLNSCSFYHSTAPCPSSPKCT